MGTKANRPQAPAGATDISADGMLPLLYTNPENALASNFCLLTPSYNPSFSHFPSTSALMRGSMRSSSGQGRVKPSVGHLRVASTPIFEPKFGRRLEGASESTGPSTN